MLWDKLIVVLSILALSLVASQGSKNGYSLNKMFRAPANILNQVGEELSENNLQQSNNTVESTIPKYIFSLKKVSWWEAMGWCTTLATKFASILSEEDQASFEKAYKLNGLNNQKVWVGGNNVIDSSKYKWTGSCSKSSKTIDFTNWDEEEPKTSPESSFCVHVTPKTNFKWKTVNCYAKYLFACQLK